MLKEYEKVRQHAGESFRRLFWDDYLQLYVWFDTRQQIVGFELSYDLLNDFRAFRWKPERGVEHYRVDSGEGRAQKNDAPILHADSSRIDPRIAAEFAARSQTLDPRIADLVHAQLRNYLHSLANHAPV